MKQKRNAPYSTSRTFDESVKNIEKNRYELNDFKEVKVFMQDIGDGWQESKDKDRELFERAYKLAVSVHNNQIRDEGTPYISHIDAILEIMKNELSDCNYHKWTVVALHDVLEDSSEVTYEELRASFNDYIANEVYLLTKKKGMSIEQYIKGIEDYEFAPTLVKIKLADRLHNVRSLNNILVSKPDKVKKYIIETEKYYIPLAERHNKLLKSKIENEIRTLKSAIH